MKKLLNFRPILFIAISLCLGLILGYSIINRSLWLSILSVALFLVGLIYYLVFSYVNKRLKKSTVFAVIIIIFFILGLLSITIKVNNFEKVNLSGHTLTVTGRITYLQENKEETFKMILSDVEFSGYKTGSTDYKIQIYCTGINDFRLGDLIKFTDKIQDYTVIYDQEFSASNISNNIRYFCNLQSENIAIRGNELTLFEKCNLFLKDSLRQGLKGDEFALAYAMLLGNSDYMDFGLLNQFRSAGIAHIFAVSGLHVGFIALVLKWCFDKIRLNKVLKIILIGSIVFFYAGVCGFSSSTVRATIMCVVLLCSEALLERYDPVSSISLSAIIILFYAPAELFCVGFQLSFVVVLGIVLLSGFFTKLFRKLPKKLAGSFATVISAQIAGIPICLAVFDKVSFISVLTNFIFLPIVSTIFIVVFICTLIGGLLSIPKIALFLPQYALYLINRLMSIVDYGFFDYGGVYLGVFSIFFYAFFLVVGGFFNLDRIIKRIVSITLAIIFLVGTVVLNINLNNSEKVVVYGSQNISFTVHNYRNSTTLILSHYTPNKSLSQLKRVMNKEDLDSLDLLIVPKFISSIDLQLFLTRLNDIDLPETIILFDETHSVNQSLIKKSFMIERIINLYDLNQISIGEMVVASETFGYGVNLTTNHFDFTVLSTISDDVALDTVVKTGKDILVLSNRKDYIFANSNAKNQISYFADERFTDAESFGYVKYVKK